MGIWRFIGDGLRERRPKPFRRAHDSLEFDMEISQVREGKLVQSRQDVVALECII